MISGWIVTVIANLNNIGHGRLWKEGNKITRQASFSTNSYLFVIAPAFPSILSVGYSQLLSRDTDALRSALSCRRAKSPLTPPEYLRASGNLALRRLFCSTQHILHILNRNVERGRGYMQCDNWKWRTWASKIKKTKIPPIKGLRTLQGFHRKTFHRPPYYLRLTACCPHFIKGGCLTYHVSTALYRAG